MRSGFILVVVGILCFMSGYHVKSWEDREEVRAAQSRAWWADRQREDCEGAKPSDLSIFQALEGR